ncbi:MAG: hypothetical protein QGM50_08415, partial [Anaerolineae bacterium]|nr:hypothetical protein [Anaerolineae bacterium]
VDFISMPTARITYDELLTQRPTIDQQVINALLDPTGYSEGTETWFGGLYIEDTETALNASSSPSELYIEDSETESNASSSPSELDLKDTDTASNCFIQCFGPPVPWCALERYSGYSHGDDYHLRRCIRHF